MSVNLKSEYNYYILLGKKNSHSEYKPLFFDIVTRTCIKDCITSKSIGTIFSDKESTRRAVKILSKRYKYIRIAKIVIIGGYENE